MKHLSKEQRYAISVMYKENKTQTEMAKAIGVSKSTICRELKRNTRPHGKVYNHEEAHLVSQKRWRNSKKHVKLTEAQNESNRRKSKVRCQVEHVFGFMVQSLRGLVFRGVGIVRAKAIIAMTNLVYNMCRLAQIIKIPP